MVYNDTPTFSSIILHTNLEIYKMYIQLKDQLFDQLYGQLLSQLCDQLFEQLYKQLNKNDYF
jgi:hypothetical protein